MKPFLRSGDFWSGLALAALGTYIVSEARGWAYMTEDGPGAGFFPLWYGGIMIALSLVLVARTVMRPAPGGQVRWKDVSRAIGCWLAFVASVALMPLLGFPIAFALLAWFIVRIMCGEPGRTALIVAIGGALGFHLLFSVALDLALPRGILF